MTVASLTTSPLPGWPRFTVDIYHQMVETGVLREGAPVELLDGVLVLKDRSKAGDDPMSIGPGHAYVVDHLRDVLDGVRAHQCRLRVQQPVTLPPDGEPEPDGAIVTDAADGYRTRHPQGREVHCVVEVADSSLEHDRTTKQQIYARAGIPQYVIINLVDRVIEVYEQPHGPGGRYGQVKTLGPGQAVDFSCGQGRAATVAVDLLLP